MIPKKTSDEILRRALDGITQETDINLVSPGSVTRAICGAHARTLSELYDVLDNTVINSFLPTASGFYLDLMGEMFGLTRRIESSAIVAREDRAIRFYVRSGTLAQRLPHPSNLNLGRIPLGTQITGGSISYTIDQDYDFPASAMETYVGAISQGTGSTQRAGAGQLSTHDLDNSTDVLVQNTVDIPGGSSLESDQEFRFRISQFVTSSQGANESAVRLAVLSAPGVADMIKTPYHAGPGSFRIVVIPTTNRLPLSSLNRISSALKDTVAYGIFYQVEEPRYLSVSISARLMPRAGGLTVSPTDRDAAEAAVRRYLGNIRPGQSLIINQLRASILGASPNIGDVSIQSLYINQAPRTLTNFTLKNDELLIPDDRMTNPILVL